MHWLKFGDGNNKYFFNSCRGRWNSNKILSIEDDNGEVFTSHNDISSTAGAYFKSLLGCHKEVNQFPDDLAINSISDEAIQRLVKPFNATDVFNTLKKMAKSKSPGPDGLTPEFFLSAWSIIGEEVVDSVLYFFKSFQLPRIVNSAAIALVPKIMNPSHMSHYRPISCCNTLYKCIAKLLASRMKQVMGKLISPSQTALSLVVELEIIFL